MDDTDDTDGTKVLRSTHDERLARLLDAGDATDRDPASILYQHTVLCQTGLPYRNPGDDVRVWERKNGSAGLEVSAGKAWDATIGAFVHLGLPYGTKPRLLLCHLNAEALRQGSSVIEVERTLTIAARTHPRSGATLSA